MWFLEKLDVKSNVLDNQSEGFAIEKGF